MNSINIKEILTNKIINTVDELKVSLKEFETTSDDDVRRSVHLHLAILYGEFGMLYHIISQMKEMGSKIFDDPKIEKIIKEGLCCSEQWIWEEIQL